VIPDYVNTDYEVFYAREGYSLILYNSPLPLLSHEMVLLVLEEDIERCERSVDAGDVLLHLYLLRIGQNFVAVDLGLHDAEAVTDHNDLVEECLNGN
jgi:hypothetical protein